MATREYLEQHGKPLVFYSDKHGIFRVNNGGSTTTIHQPRYRRPCTGELIQIDGCDHHWFENRGRPCTALVYIVDATSRLMHLLFVKSESTFTYFEATRGYIEKYGKPMILYSDKASVFRVNNKHATTGPGETQFARAMRCLNITPLCAETSQAKGRVERAHLTLQDRLVKELLYYRSGQCICGRIHGGL